ncbi:helix-turn-helix domain-containing protein [Sphingobacterium cavernae]|uniref:helix-turn-helix domain-containing protein n=1 Tax=Sphingobacterium cavernae TaxID=2592657 RepID=UPI00122FCC52|nr:helix-turn-helix transcriptional regulator [Sphingobacterium cavernae]
MYVGKKLKELRVQLDMNQTQMADTLSVSQSYYSSIEKGKKPITNRLMNMIIEKFDLDRGYFGLESISKNITNEGILLGGDMGGNGDIIAFNKAYEVNKLAFYLNHSSKRLERILNTIKDDLKLAIDTYDKAIDIMQYFDAPNFMKEEYSKVFVISELENDIEDEIKEDYANVSDYKTLICLKILRNEDNILQVQRSLMLLINDIHKYRDMFTNKKKT